MYLHTCTCRWTLTSNVKGVNVSPFALQAMLCFQSKTIDELIIKLCSHLEKTNFKNKLATCGWDSYEEKCPGIRIQTIPTTS